MLAAWEDFKPLAGIHEGLSLPSAPDQPVEYDHIDRPQPRLDRMRGAGMASTVGRLRPCTLFDWKFVVLSHNTIRGAAGAAILNAEAPGPAGQTRLEVAPDGWPRITAASAQWSWRLASALLNTHQT